jgi:hypothetical protein
LTGNTSNGGSVNVGYVYDPAPANLDFLAAGQQLTITYTVKVNDGSADSNTQNVTFTITGTNDAELLDLNNTTGGVDTSISYTVGAAAAAIAPSATITQVDSADLNGGTLTVSFTGETGTSADQLTIENQGTGAGQIGVSGTNITFGGVVIGTFTGGTNGSNLVVSFNASATDAAAQALAEHILYSNATSGTATKTLSYTLVDGDDTANGGSDTSTASATINVTGGGQTVALTTGTDTITFTSGTNFVTGNVGNNANNTTANNGDKITGGTGTDTLTINFLQNPGTLTFGNGTNSVGLTGFENLVLTDSNNGNHTDSVVFNSTFNNGGTLNVDASGIGGNGSLSFNASASSNAFNVIGTANGDSFTLGSGTEAITTGNGADTIVAGSGKSVATVGGSGNAGTISGYDTITDFAPASDFLDLQGTPIAAAATAGTNGTDSSLTIGGQTVKSHAIANGMITFDDANTFSTALSLTSLSDVAAVVQYLQRNDLGNAGTTVAFTAVIGGVSHTFIYEQVGNNPSAANDILIDLANVTLGGGTNVSALISNGHVMPAGVAGSPIDLGLTNPAADGQPVLVTIANVPVGWAVQGGTLQSDGSWTIQTADPSSLLVVPLANFTGALELSVTLSWMQADGSTASMTVSDNVEAYAPATPIFAWSGDDALTGYSGADTFVFSQPIGADVIQNFDVGADKVDLIAYATFQSFADVLANLTADANGNALITLADGQTITIVGVPPAALTAANFEFDVTPTVENAGTMTIGDSALLPLSGVIDNSGTIALHGKGEATTLQLIENGITLQGGGSLTLSDSAYNVITGSVSGVTFTNVDNVISGAGQLGAGSLTLVNGGTINADGTNALVIDTGSNLVTNSGTIEATGLGGLEIVGSIANSGLVWANGGNVTVGGDITGGGDLRISGSATLELGGSDANGVILDANATGVLVLDDVTGFNGAISGLNGNDQVDLRDVAFGSSTTMSYADDGAGGGVLTITDGANSVQLKLVGSYQLSDFSLGSDGHGGSLLVNHAGGITNYAAGDTIDASSVLSVAAGTDVVTDGYVRVTTTGLVQVDANGGGDNWLTLGTIDPSAGQYTVEYLANGAPVTVTLTEVAPPIGIDLNGDGVVSFVGTDAGVTFDYGAGKVGTAWVGPQDGILVNDSNHDGQVTANEIVFSTGDSDLQGLSQFDTNHDGQLTAADAAFSQFAVWQDANSNGVVDAGEMKGLAALGITGITLSSDGISYSAAGGDVQVVGTGSVSYADGRTGVLADAVFATASQSAAEQLRVSSALSSNAALLGAVAAAGLAAMPAHAEFRETADARSEAQVVQFGVQTGQSLAVELSAANHALGNESAVPLGVTAAAEAVQPSAPLMPSSDVHAVSFAAEPEQQMAELLQGTSAHGNPVAKPLSAAGSVSPVTAEMLQAAMAGVQHAVQKPGATVDASAHGSAELGQVLADALAVAGSKPDIESLLNAVGGSVHDQVLAHTAIGGSGAHELFGGALIEDRTLMQMHETVMLHQLAAPSH